MEIMQDRRSECRMLCADMLEVRWRDDRGRRRRAVALLEDISESGACLQMEGPIPPDTEICWESPDQHLSGVVRHCTYREIGYFIGVEFSPGSKWSEKSFHPQHLLNVQKLAERMQRESKASRRVMTIQ